jgi:TolB-like protein
MNQSFSRILFHLAAGVSLICCLMPVAKADALAIAVADFTCSDAALGRMISDVVLTDLAQSPDLTVVERGELRQALSELKLQSTGLTQPEAAKKLGKLLAADRVIVGSAHISGDSLVLTARSVNIQSGVVSSGQAATSSGQRASAAEVAHKLASALHKKLTGKALVLGDPEPIRSDEQPAIREDEHLQEPIVDDQSTSKLVDPRKRGNDKVTEADVLQISAALRGEPMAKKSVGVPARVVTRVWTMVTLIKAIAPQHLVAQYNNTALGDRLLAGGTPPVWAEPFISMAVEESWWPSDRALNPSQPATWTFVRSILEHMPREPLSQEQGDGYYLNRPRVTTNPKSPRNKLPSATTARRPIYTPTLAREPRGAFSGLIVDARGLSLSRDMSPRVLDEDGRIVYPDTRNLPSYDQLLDRGLASYYTDPRDAVRCGSSPLTVRALSVAGAARTDVVVSMEDARRIREAEQDSRFFSRTAVAIVK